MSDPRGLWTIKPSMREVEEAIDAERRYRKEVEADRDAYREALETIDDLLTRLLEPLGLPNDPQLRSPIVLIRDVARAVLAGDHDQGAQT